MVTKLVAKNKKIFNTPADVEKNLRFVSIGIHKEDVNRTLCNTTLWNSKQYYKFQRFNNDNAWWIATYRIADDSVWLTASVNSDPRLKETSSTLAHDLRPTLALRHSYPSRSPWCSRPINDYYARQYNAIFGSISDKWINVKWKKL